MPDGDLATKRLSRRTFLLGGGAGFALLSEVLLGDRQVPGAAGRREVTPARSGCP